MKLSTAAGLLAASITLVSGCASQIMGDLVGKDVSQVVAKYGQPINAFDMPDGRRAFQWRQDNSYYVPATTTVNVYGSGNYATGTATTYGGYSGTTACFYTLYAKPNAQRSYTVVGFEPPRIDCE